MLQLKNSSEFNVSLGNMSLNHQTGPLKSQDLLFGAQKFGEDHEPLLKSELINTKKPLDSSLDVLKTDSGSEDSQDLSDDSQSEPSDPSED